MLFDKIKSDQMNARTNKQGRDMIEISLLNTLISDITTLAKAELREVTEKDCNTILNKYVNFTNENKKLYSKAGNAQKLDETLQEIAIISRYLPKQMTSEELEATVAEIFANSGLEKNIASMGKLMAAIKAKHEGTYNGQEASTLVRKFLA